MAACEGVMHADDIVESVCDIRKESLDVLLYK